MAHILDKDTVNRIMHLHIYKGLSAQIIAQRFGFTTARVHGVIRRAASSKPWPKKKYSWEEASSIKPQAASVKPEDLHVANTTTFKQQASSIKHQAPSATKKTQ
jgi:hypothetical protein